MNSTVLENSKPSRTKLLIVDDDNLVLATLSMGFREEGYEVYDAGSAAEALELAEKQQPDLAILDIRMPGQSGIELANVLYERWQIPFLFLTAFSDKETLDQAVAEGALGYLVKPVDINKVIPAVETALSRARDLRSLEDRERNLNRALHTGRDTSVAIGLIMAHSALNQDEAEQALRRYARQNRIKMRVVAERVIEAAERLNSIVRDIVR